MTSWASEESQVESQEYQDNANVRHQPFPESVSEKSDIQTNYDGYHCHQVQRDSDLSARFSLHCLHYLESRIDKVADLACPRAPGRPLWLTAFAILTCEIGGASKFIVAMQ